MTEDAPARPAIVIEEGLRDGAHASVVAMHGAYYARAWRFDAFFERKVATELAEFMSRYDRSHDRMFLAVEGGRIAGSLIVDGGETDATVNGAHLRWFIVDDAYQGRGIGTMLIGAAMDFVRTSGFARCYLTTFAGLDSARSLYERAGFKLVREARSETWGTPVAEQFFVWTR